MNRKMKDNKTTLNVEELNEVITKNNTDIILSIIKDINNRTNIMENKVYELQLEIEQLHKEIQRK